MDLYKPVFDNKQFYAAIPGLIPSTLLQWKARVYVNLTVNEGPGQRPIYPPIDLFQTALGVEVSHLGAPALSKLPALWLHVRGRIIAHETGLAGPDEMQLVLYVGRHDDQLYIGEYDPKNLPDENPGVPDLWVLFPVDRWIRRTRERMRSVLAGEAAKILPRPVAGDYDFDEYGRRTFVGLSLAESREVVRLGSADTRTDNEDRRFRELDYRHLLAKYRREFAYHPDKPDIMQAWTKDKSGRPVQWGLTVEETAEIVELDAKYMAWRDSERFGEWTTEDDARRKDLHEKHHRASAARIFNGGADA